MVEELDGIRTRLGVCTFEIKWETTPATDLFGIRLRAETAILKGRV